nr:copia protein [Tanacetum cinerariifolium]
MTGNRKLFSSYKAYNEGNVIFGSNLRGNIIGKGQICDNKCRVTFSEHDSEITKEGKVIGKGIRKKCLYVMKLGNKPNDQICLATIDENFTLWHRRLGHVNMRLIQSLASKELVRNLPKLKFDQYFCDACKMGKQSHASHKAKNIVSTTRCLELLHMDIFGPSTVRSYRGNRYTLVIVDDYSRIDDGKEIDNEVQFGEFCNANGITHNFSAPRTPQSNGVVERKNKTLQEMDHVYKVKKALYGFKQAPKAWYDRLKAFLIKHEYKMGMVDNTTKKKSSDLIIVQIYVDDIIFGSTCQDMCDDFAKIMHDEFEMSMMGELNFFFGLQIKQMEDGIFFNQSKYIKEILKKFGREDSKPMKTPMSFDTKLSKDEECESVDSTKYQGMIGSLLYLTESRPDIMFSVCLCARFQEAPKTSHIEVVKHIFRYIKGTMHLGLWYPKGIGIEIVVYANSDHTGDYVDQKSTSGICTFVECCLTSWFSKKQTALTISTTEAEYTSNALHNVIMEAGGKDRPPMLAPESTYECTWKDKDVLVSEGSSETTTKRYMENYKNVSQDIRDQLNAETEAIQIILTGIYNDIYSTVDACPNACEMWKAIKRLKQGESINVQDLETNLYWEFRKFTSRDGESLESYYARFYKMMNELVRNQYDKMSKAKEIDKLMALISLSFKKIYKPTNNNLRTSSNTSRANQDNSPRISRGTGYDSQRIVNVDGAKETVGTTVVQKYEIWCYNCKEYGHVARECQKPKQAKDAAYQKEKMLLCKQEEAGFPLNAEQADWRDDIDDEPEDQELEAHYVYMAQIQEVTPDAADNSGPIFDSEPLQRVSNNDNYNVFAIESEHPEQSKSVNDTYPIEKDEHNVIIDSLDMSYDREQVNQDDDDDLANERDLLASLIEKLKCEIVDSKNRNKFLETSNKAIVDKLKGEIEVFKTKNKTLESLNNHFKEANNELSKTNQLMYKDLKKFQAELDKYHNVKYASKVEIDCAKAKGDLMSYKMEFEKSSNKYTQKINDLNQTISKMKKELSAYQETISILSQQKEAQIKFHKTREDKELDKVIALENKVKVLDNIVYKTGQSVQTMNMLNHNYKMSFAKPEFLKKAQRANPRLYDIGCYNDNLALMLAPESDEVIRLEKESRSKLSDLIRPFDYEKLNNLYDLFVPQREKSSAQRYSSKRLKMSHTPVNNGNSKETFNKQTTLLEKQMDESIL